MRSQLSNLAILGTVALIACVWKKPTIPPKVQKLPLEHEAFTAESLHMLQHDLQEVRILAMRVLGPLPDEPATIRVMKMLNDLTAAVRQIALRPHGTQLALCAKVTKSLAKLKEFIESLPAQAALHKSC